MKENKKPIGKIILAILLVIAIGVGVYGTIIGLKDEIEHKKKEEKYLESVTTKSVELSEKAKDFSCEGFSITLTEDFEVNEETESALSCFSEGIELYVFKDEFDKGAKELSMSAEEYLYSLVDTEDSSVSFSELNGVPCAEYAFIGEYSGKFKIYTVLCYKGADSFWLVHFVTEKEYDDCYEEYISEWAKTIKAE